MNWRKRSSAVRGEIHTIYASPVLTSLRVYAIMKLQGGQLDGEWGVVWYFEGEG